MKFSKVIVVTSIFLWFMSFTASISTAEPVGGIDRDYYFRIELSQWSVKAYDMNQIEDLMLQGLGRDKAIEMSEYSERIGPIQKGSHVYLEIYSFDVQHGLSAQDLDLTIVVDAMQPGRNYHKPTFADFDVPNGDKTISIFCHVYCGLGHSNMKLNFVIGNGSPNYSKLIISTIIGANLVIFLIIFFSLFKQAPEKIMLYPLKRKDVDSKLYIGDQPDYNPNNGKRIGIFRVSHLTEKQIIELRINKMRIEKLGDLIGFYNCESVEQAMDLVETVRHSNNWEILG